MAVLTFSEDGKFSKSDLIDKKGEVFESFMIFLQRFTECSGRFDAK
jgi:hypothetical protein